MKCSNWVTEGDIFGKTGKRLNFVGLLLLRRVSWLFRRKRKKKKEGEKEGRVEEGEEQKKRTTKGRENEGENS